jgi:hypothetical protein
VILRSIRKGQWRLDAVCTTRGECDLLEFLQAPPGDALAGDKARMLRLFEWVSSAGPPRNDEISHIIDRPDGIWEFIKGRVRVAWFYDEGRMVILSHGFIKATKKTPPAEIERARRARNEYLRDKKAQRITYQEDE